MPKARRHKIRTRATALAFLLTAGPAPAQWIAQILHPSVAYESHIRAVHLSHWAGAVQATAGPDSSAAALWSSPVPGWTNLGTGFAVVAGLDGSQQVGTRNGRAALWAGSASSYVDLHPAGALASTANAVASGKQVGWTDSGQGRRAALWHGSSSSWVDLHPAGARYSQVFATDGLRHWGAVDYPAPGGQITHGGYWTDQPGSFTSLNPGAQWSSAIRGIGGTQQVGYTWPALGLGQHATLWNGTPESWLDVHPFPGFGSSQLNATTGTVQVGWSHVPGFSFPRPGAWFGSASSFVDLSQFLPAGYGGGEAFSVTQDGDRIIVGGYANGPSGRAEAVIWTYVPAPGVLPLLAAAGLWAGRRRRSPTAPP